MTTIPEELDEDLAFSQLLALPDSALADIAATTTTSTSTIPSAALPSPPGLDWCPRHRDDATYLSNGFLEDWDVPEPAPEESLASVQEPDYSRFENWIPKFVRPEKPCDYCRSRRMNCYVQRGEPFCTPCASLFRECSLSKSNTLEANNYVEGTSNFLDTLGLIDEDACKERGTLTGIKTLRSKAGIASSASVRADDAPGSSKRNGIRFPRHAVKILREWLESHADNPYPNDEEKAGLEKRTELKPSQIANWLANARRRRKASEKSRPRVAESPSLRPATVAIPIPRADKPWDELNPFERWKHSPPENEPASMLDIANAVANNQVPDEGASASPSTLGRSSKRRKGSSDGSSFTHNRAPSTTSLETRQTSSLSSSSAAFSKTSSQSTHGSYSSFSSSLAGKKDRRRRRRPTAPAAGRKPSDDRKRIFQCTFCTDTFKSKYDWTRHEKSLHLSLEKWICAPYGPIEANDQEGKQCTYCGLHNPSSDHIETHNHHQCEDKGIDARTFYRKDHLRQHLRLMHGCEMTEAMESWRHTAIAINSRCGFCSQRFSVWQERVDHLTAHFKAGARMSEWKGCRGLDPAVAAQVTNAMPPYLIGMESVSPNPFSASNRAGVRNTSEWFSDSRAAPGPMCQLQHAAGEATSNCWEILTVKLGKYAQEMALKGEVMTDEMLQKRARQILYDSDDSWNQTAADNTEWLDLFKKAHGLNFIPSALGGQGSAVPEDLETYGDLGLRIPFAVQLQAYNQAQTGGQDADAATRSGPYQQARSNLGQIYDVLSKECSLSDGDQPCNHLACVDNVIQFAEQQPNGEPTRAKRWCTQQLSSDAARKLLSVMSNHPPVEPEEPSAAENMVRAMEVLGNLDAHSHQQLGSCYSDVKAQAAANARARGLNTLVQQENACCSWSEHNPDLMFDRARARAQGLAALTRVEAGEVDDCRAAPPGRSSYMPRHRYELPRDKARLFATTTGAWDDCGVMPQAVETSLPNIEETTSTGAVMEFLGGNIGAALPFSRDALSSRIPLPRTYVPPVAPESDWHMPDGSTVTQQEMMTQLNDLVHGTTSAGDGGEDAFTGMDLDWMTTAEFDPNLTATTTERMEANALPAMDNDDNDVNFDDFTFEDIFDMPLDDETFGTNGAA